MSRRALFHVVWLVVATNGAGCINRDRLNDDCVWSGDTARALALTNPSDRQHLIADAQLAEGLAVRYADAEHRRRFGYGGHGRLVEHGRVLQACMATLVDRIEQNHEVAAADIDVARAQRDPRFDAPVMLSFGIAYVAAAAIAVRWIRRRFGESPGPGASVTAGASVGFSLMGVQAGAVWGAIWECVRIGDSHFGTFRAARPPWGEHLTGLFVGGIVLFLIVAVAIDTSRGKETL